MIDEKTRWQDNQPGFYAASTQDFRKAFWRLGRRNSEVDWDGTFNQPVVPLADPMHRDTASSFSF